jgi:peroxiredoxin
MFNRRSISSAPAALVLLLAMCLFPLSCSGKESKQADAKKAGSKATETALSAESYAAAHNVIKLGEPAPAVALRDAQGESVTIAAMKGKTFIIAFWHPTCKPCIDMMKELEKAFAADKAAVTILAVTADEGEKKNAEKAKTLSASGLKAKAVFDLNNGTARAYEMTTVPYFALVDKKGDLRYAGSFIVSQTIRTMTFIEMATRVAKGVEVPRCELPGMVSASDYSSVVGKPAPAFKLKGLDGLDQSPVFYKGFSRLLVTFWSPGCPHCKMQLPRVESFIRSDGRRLGVQGMTVVGIPEKSNPETPQYVSLIDQIAAQLQLTQPIALDYGGEADTLYKVRGVPSMYLIGRDGTIEHAWRGQFLFTGETVECVISEMGGGK